MKVLEGRYGELAKEKEEAQQMVEDLTQQVSARATELESEKKERATEAERLKVLEGKYGELAKEKEEAQQMVEDLTQQNELSLLQLHEVQEELEHNFYQMRGKDELLQRHQAQQLRAKQLISKLLNQS